MESYTFVLASIVIVFLALFADDIRLALCPPSTDFGFLVLTYVLLGVFTLEMGELWNKARHGGPVLLLFLHPCLTCQLLIIVFPAQFAVVLSFVKPKYLFSFYFFLDLIATVSLVFDIPQVQEAITVSGVDDSAETTSLMRASRTSRIGTRAGRVARLVRFMRLVRMLKVYKRLAIHLARMSKHSLVEERGGEDDLDEDGNPRTAESRVGVKLTELTTRRIIIGVLLLIFILPLFAVESGFYGVPGSFAVGLTSRLSSLALHLFHLFARCGFAPCACLPLTSIGLCSAMASK
jgi:hypothetical protein